MLHEPKPITLNFMLPYNRMNSIEREVLAACPKLPENGFIRHDLRNAAICLKWKTKTVVSFKNTKNLNKRLEQGIKVIHFINLIEQMIKNTDLTLEYRKREIFIKSDGICEFSSNEFSSDDLFLSHVRKATSLSLQQSYI